MTLDFDDLPEMSEPCWNCNDGTQWNGQPCDCISDTSGPHPSSRVRLTKFGKAIMTIVKKFGAKDEKSTA